MKTELGMTNPQFLSFLSFFDFDLSQNTCTNTERIFLIIKMQDMILEYEVYSQSYT